MEARLKALNGDDGRAPASLSELRGRLASLTGGAEGKPWANDGDGGGGGGGGVFGLGLQSQAPLSEEEEVQKILNAITELEQLGGGGGGGVGGAASLTGGASASASDDPIMGMGMGMGMEPGDFDELDEMEGHMDFGALRAEAQALGQEAKGAANGNGSNGNNGSGEEGAKGGPEPDEKEVDAVMNEAKHMRDDVAGEGSGAGWLTSWSELGPGFTDMVVEPARKSKSKAKSRGRRRGGSDSEGSYDSDSGSESDGDSRDSEG